MNINANSIRILYRAKKITIEGVREAVSRGWISVIDYKNITGQEYTKIEE